MSDAMILQGSFVSTGLTQPIILRSDVDWMHVIDYTRWNATPGGALLVGTEFWWQRGMPAGMGLAYSKLITDAVLSTPMVAGTGFTLIDSSANMLSVPRAITAGTNVTGPVYTCAAADLPSANGAVVRIQNSAQLNLNGLDFTMNARTVAGAGSTFALANILATAPGVASGACTYREVAPDIATYNLFYPQHRTVANITAANPAVVTTLVDHGYVTGQQVRINVPASCGMIEMNSLLGTVTVLTAGTFSVNIDATAFTAFNFPVAAAMPVRFAEVVPVGVIPTLNAVNISDATRNIGYIGMLLQGGLAAAGAAANGPAGVLNDVMYWRAGKSFNL